MLSGLGAVYALSSEPTMVQGVVSILLYLDLQEMTPGTNTILTTTPLLRAITTMSIGYFVHDSIDMIVNEKWSRAVAELLLHHFLSAAGKKKATQD